MWSRKCGLCDVLCVSSVNRGPRPKWSSWNPCPSWAANPTSQEEASGSTTPWEDSDHNTLSNLFKILNIYYHTTRDYQLLSKHCVLPPGVPVEHSKLQTAVSHTYWSFVFYSSIFRIFIRTNKLLSQVPMILLITLIIQVNKLFNEYKHMTMWL